MKYRHHKYLRCHALSPPSRGAWIEIDRDGYYWDDG